MRRLAAVLVLGLAAALSLSPLAEVDFHWHLLAGQQILAGGEAPRVDQFTYTSAGRPWIDLHWLFQASVAWIEGRAGWGALDLFKVTMVLAACTAALTAGAVRGGLLAAAAIALPAVITAQERFTLRPEMVSFALFGSLLLLLARRRDRPALLFAVPPLLALWANLHSLYAVGLATLALALAGDLYEAWRRSAWRPVRPLALAMLLALPATLMTPYGTAGWGLARTLLVERVAAANLYGRGIAEFQPPFGGFGRTASVAAFALLIAIVMAAAIAGRRALGAADRLLLLAFLLLALMARRNMALFAFAAIALAPSALRATWERARVRLGRAGGTGLRLATYLPRAIALMVCGLTIGGLHDVVTNRFFARDGTQRAFGLGVAPAFYPAALAQAVIDGGLDGEVLNDMTMGGFLAGRWFPGRRTYIDGRLEVQAPGLFATYVVLQRDPVAFERETRARGIAAVLWSHAHVLDAVALLRHLATDPGWRLQAVDLTGALFVRPEAWRGAAPVALDGEAAPQLAAHLIAEAEEAAVLARSADPIPAGLRRLVPRREIPAGETGAAIFLALVGRPAIALPLLSDAARRAPWSASLHHDLGTVLAALGRDAEARAAFEAAIELDPGLAGARAAIGDLAWRAGDPDGALAAWEEAGRSGALPAASRRARATLHAGRGRLDEAIDDLRAAVAQDPDRAAWRSDLAALYAQRGLLEPALREVRRARALDPRDCRLALQEAALLGASGDLAGAEAARRAALDIDPACGAGGPGVTPPSPPAAPPSRP